MPGAPDYLKPPPATQNIDVDTLRQELRALLDDYENEKQSEQIKEKNSQSESRKERLKRRAHEIGEEIRQRLFAELQVFIAQNFGPQFKIESTRVSLEAVNGKGQITEIPVNIQVRPLRLLSDPMNVSLSQSVLGTNEVAFNLYEDLPLSVTYTDEEAFWRNYTEDNASSIKTEAKMLVALKGGGWREMDGPKPVANVIAVRGLDFDDGLKENGNRTYDDTMFVIVENPQSESEVFEYRITTESSSVKRGVGRLDSKQVTYVRGLHRGKDPGYRLKNDLADGTRTGLEGSFQITGANIHSAYTKLTIDSETLLSPGVSLGCQVVATGKRPFENAMVSVLDKKDIKEFFYTIVEGGELEVLDTALRQNGKQSVLIHGIPRHETPSTEQ